MPIPKKLAYFKYFLALLLFGLNGIVASHIALSSYEIVFTRTLIGSLFLISIFLFSKQKLQVWNNRNHLFFIVISGVAMGTSWMFLYEAYVQIGVSLATLAYYSGPILVMILSPLLFREKVAKITLFGFFTVVVGMLCVNGQALLQGAASWGMVFGILSAIMYAFMVIFNKKAVSITGLENPMWQLVASFITVTLFLVFKQGLPIFKIDGNLIPILILGIVNTGLGCYFYFSSIGEMPVQTVAIFGYLEPLSALLFSAFLLGETMSRFQIVGAVLILGGAAFGELLRGEQLLAKKLQPLR